MNSLPLRLCNTFRVYCSRSQIHNLKILMVYSAIIGYINTTNNQKCLNDDRSPYLLLQGPWMLIKCNREFPLSEAVRQLCSVFTSNIGLWRFQLSLSCDSAQTWLNIKRHFKSVSWLPCFSEQHVAAFSKEEVRHFVILVRENCPVLDCQLVGRLMWCSPWSRQNPKSLWHIFTHNAS